MENQTLGLANHVIDLNVATLRIRSPRSHGLHNGASDNPAEAECKEWWWYLSTTLGSTSASADSGFERFVPLLNSSNPEPLLFI